MRLCLPWPRAEGGPEASPLPPPRPRPGLWGDGMCLGRSPSRRLPDGSLLTASSPSFLFPLKGSHRAWPPEQAHWAASPSALGFQRLTTSVSPSPPVSPTSRVAPAGRNSFLKSPRSAFSAPTRTGLAVGRPRCWGSPGRF